MRIFVAAELPQKVKDNLERSAMQFADFDCGGKFVPKDNYHITLHFLGNVAPSDLIYVQSAMDSAKDLPAIELAMSQFVMLRAGDIVCAKLKNSPQLTQLHDLLGDKLEQNGFEVEHRAYRPHVTMIREKKFTLPFSEVTKNVDVYNKPFEMNRIVLFESVFAHGGVSYRPLYAVTLAPQAG